MYLYLLLHIFAVWALYTSYCFLSLQLREALGLSEAFNLLEGSKMFKLSSIIYTIQAWPSAAGDGGRRWG